MEEAAAEAEENLYRRKRAVEQMTVVEQIDLEGFGQLE